MLPGYTQPPPIFLKPRWSLLWNSSVFAGLVAKQILLPLILVSPRTRGCEQRVGGWKGQMEGQIEVRGWVDYAGQMERQIEGGVGMGGGVGWTGTLSKSQPHKRQC